MFICKLHVAINGTDVDAKTKADGYPHDFIIQSQPAGGDGDGMQPVATVFA